jgi:hypothetical protein
MTVPSSLVPNLYLAPTPAGALHVVTEAGSSAAEQLVREVLRAPHALRSDQADVMALSGASTLDAAVDAVAQAQQAGWLEGNTDVPLVPEGPLGKELPGLLAPLSETGQAALDDDQGFALSSVGFNADIELDVSTLAAELLRLKQRRGIVDSSSGAFAGFALVDRFGASTVGFFPLLVGTQQFVLIVGGLPRLHHPSFVPLVSALSRRYDSTAEPGETSTTSTTSPGGSSHA